MAGTLAAQTIEVRVREGVGGAPVAGAIVRLIDPDGRSRAQGLANDAGRVVLQVPAPGAWRLRVDGIGYQGHESGVSLGVGEGGRREIVLQRTPQELPELESTISAGCGAEGRRTALPEVLAIWGEIQKALVATQLTQEGELVVVRSRTWERRLDRRGALIREDLLTDRLLTGSVPFHTLSPEVLARFGFRTRHGILEFYAGPDAALLNSEAFLATHCFRAVPSPRDRPGFLGLGFRPREARDVVDIDGVLWIDRASRELRFLEYRYTGLAIAGAGPESGGRMAFRRLPGGAWIVDDWWIRTQSMALVFDAKTGQPTGRDSLLGYVETVGRAEVVPRGTPLTAAIGPPAILVGTLHDSLTGVPLAGARVTVPGAVDTAVSDTGGRFRLEVSGSGERVVTVRHRRLGLVADRSTQTLRFLPGQETTLSLAVPPVRDFARVFCPARQRGEAGLIGLTLAGEDPSEGLLVRLSWVAPAGARAVQQQGVEVRSEARGIYAFCDLPAGRVIQVELRRDGAVVGRDQVELRPGEFRWLELGGGK